MTTAPTPIEPPHIDDIIRDHLNGDICDDRYGLAETIWDSVKPRTRRSLFVSLCAERVRLVQTHNRNQALNGVPSRPVGSTSKFGEAAFRKMRRLNPLNQAAPFDSSKRIREMTLEEVVAAADRYRETAETYVAEGRKYGLLADRMLSAGVSVVGDAPHLFLEIFDV